jgi:hypothetical protein
MIPNHSIEHKLMKLIKDVEKSQRPGSQNACSPLNLVNPSSSFFSAAALIDVNSPAAAFPATKALKSFRKSLKEIFGCVYHAVVRADIQKGSAPHNNDDIDFLMALKKLTSSVRGHKGRNILQNCPISSISRKSKPRRRGNSRPVGNCLPEMMEHFGP